MKFTSVGTFNQLHPTSKAMLEAPFVPPWEMSLAENRLGFQRRLRDIGGPLAPVHSIETVTSDGGTDITLYRPHLNGPLPLFVFIHGGGWVVGEHHMYHSLCTRIAMGAGCAVASIGYGLSPENVFPKAVEQCQQAYDWLQDSSEWLGFIPGQVAVGGDSAGGNLSAALGVLATQGHLRAPRGLWLIYPVTDMLADTPSRNLFGSGYGLDTDLMAWFGQQYVSGGEDEASQVLASPGRMNATTAAAFPQTLIQTAGFDPLKDEAKDMATLLDAHGKLLAYTCYEEMTHGFINAFALLDEATMAVDEGTLWLRRMFA